MYTAIMLIIGLLAVALIVGGVIHRPHHLDDFIARMETTVAEGRWQEAEREIARLTAAWPRARFWLYLDAGENTIVDFERTVYNLQVEVREKRAPEAQVHLSSLKALIPKF